MFGNQPQQPNTDLHTENNSRGLGELPDNVLKGSATQSLPKTGYDQLAPFELASLSRPQELVGDDL